MAGIIQNLKQDAVAQICLKQKKTTSKRKKKDSNRWSEQSNCQSVFLALIFFSKGRRR